MTTKNFGRKVLYLPDSPNVGDTESSICANDSGAAALNRARADDIAAKVSIGDELSGYEIVAGRGVP